MSIVPMRVGYRRTEKETVKQRQQYYVTSRMAPLPRSQTRNAWEDRMGSSFDEYVPFSHDYGVYDSMRNNVPLIEACYTKYKMLISEPVFSFEGNRQVEKLANEFIKEVRVNQFSQGLHEWIVELVDSGLHYGNGYGELVPTIGLNDVAFLKNAPSKFIRFIKGGENGNLILGQYDKNGFRAIPFKNQDFIYHLAFWKRDGHPQGYSLLYSLPFVVNTFQYIELALRKTWIRAGDPTFVFLVETTKETEADYQAGVETIADFESKMDTIGQSRLMGKYGDVTAALPPGAKFVMKTIGEGVTMPELEVSMRTMVEQIVAQTGFPLFMFGYHWGGNYNLTTHQNDMIVNQINYIRKCIDPLINKLFRQFFLLKGLVNVKYEWTWPDVNLRDEVEQARAAQLKANALKIGIEARLNAMDYGLLTPQSFVEYLVEEGVEDERNLKYVTAGKMAENFKRRFEIMKAMELAGKLAA